MQAFIRCAGAWCVYAQALSIAVNFTADTIEVTQADYEDVHRKSCRHSVD
ncbi:MAG: hypothetical protein ACLVK8_01040 [Ruminococcus sp.]